MNDERSPYFRFGGEDLILRDELAIDRTILANERTLLSYLRSSLALIISGFTAMHLSYEGAIRFFDGYVLLGLGVASVIFGCVIGLIGLWRFLAMNRSIAVLRSRGKRLADSQK